MFKKTLCLLVAVMLSFCVLYVDAAKSSDMLRIYKRTINDSEFSYTFSGMIGSFSDYNLTKDEVIVKMKEFISDIIDDADAETKKGLLNENNLVEQVETIIIQRILMLENNLFTLMVDNLTDEELEGAFRGEFPERFNGLYDAVYKELKFILGFSERGVEIIFDDMIGYEWSYEAVDALFNDDIINGMSDFMYCPGEQVTREQFVKLLCEAFGIQKGNETYEFLDVDENMWYYPYIDKMASNGLINGIGNGEFGIGKNITRQDMAVMMYRVGEKLGRFSSLPTRIPFEDNDAISSYAKNAVSSLRAYEIVNGDTENRFNPLSNATRAEAAQIIYNMYKFN